MTTNWLGRAEGEEPMGVEGKEGNSRGHITHLRTEERPVWLAPITACSSHYGFGSSPLLKPLGDFKRRSDKVRSVFKGLLRLMGGAGTGGGERTWVPADTAVQDGDHLQGPWEGGSRDLAR